jgi:hypothetical protein
MIRKLRSRARHAWRNMRAGRGLRLGPFELMWSPVLSDLRWKAAQAQNSTPAAAAASKTQRSVVFVNNAYYNFFYLARALRDRGWDAINVSVENPDGPNAIYYHGEDLNLYDADPDVMHRNIVGFFDEVKVRFRMVHFYGIGQMSFFPTSYDYSDDFDVLPLDFIELKKLGIKIGNSNGGCSHGISQTAFSQWSAGCCNRCVWQNQPAVCSDRRNLAWGHKVESVVDLHATEGNPALDYQGTKKCYREPLTTALDPEVWRPDLPIPERLRLQRTDDEVLIYHAVGNLKTRSSRTRNIKGTPAILDAIERLQAEGLKVRLEFATDVPNLDVRFIQAQCDIIIDQLNFGRYGATGREAMMLGKTTVCRLDPHEPDGVKTLQALTECPIVTADEASIYAVLRELVLDPDRRRITGEASRRYALKWHSAEACAQRYEEVYDRLMRGLAPVP